MKRDFVHDEDGGARARRPRPGRAGRARGELSRSPVLAREADEYRQVAALLHSRQRTSLRRRNSVREPRDSRDVRPIGTVRSVSPGSCANRRGPRNTIGACSVARARCQRWCSPSSRADRLADERLRGATPTARMRREGTGRIAGLGRHDLAHPM